jgi:putative ABC transport system permease protein
MPPKIAAAHALPAIPAIHTNALTVDAASLALPAAGTYIAQGVYLNAVTAREPVAVLGADARRARRPRVRQ